MFHIVKRASNNIILWFSFLYNSQNARASARWSHLSARFTFRRRSIFLWTQINLWENRRHVPIIDLGPARGKASHIHTNHTQLLHYHCIYTINELYFRIVFHLAWMREACMHISFDIDFLFYSVVYFGSVSCSFRLRFQLREKLEVKFNGLFSFSLTASSFDITWIYVCARWCMVNEFSKPWNDDFV